MLSKRVFSLAIKGVSYSPIGPSVFHCAFGTRSLLSLKRFSSSDVATATSSSNSPLQISIINGTSSDVTPLKNLLGENVSLNMTPNGRKTVDLTSALDKPRVLPSSEVSEREAKYVTNLHYIPTKDVDSSALSSLDKTLITSDLTILLTGDGSFSSVLEDHILNAYLARGKQNILVCVAGDDSIKSVVESNLAKKVVSSDIGLLKPRLPPIIALDSLKDTVTHLTSQTNAQSLRDQKDLFVAWLSVQDSLTNYLKTSELFSRIEVDVSIAQNTLQTWQDRVYLEFVQRDLGQLQGTLVSFRDNVIQDVFDATPFWKLFWASDDVGNQVATVLNNHSLLRIEHQMSFSMGSASESLRGQIHYLQSALNVIQSNALSSKLPESSPVVALVSDLSRLQSFLQKQLPPSGPDVDPYVLRNEVATFHQADHLRFLERSVAKLVGQTYLLDGSVISLFLGSWYLGVPVAIGIPVMLLGLVGSLGLMKLRWRLLQRSFLNRLSRTQNGLKEKLRSLYSQEYERAVAAPIKTSVSMIQDAVQARKSEWIAEQDRLRGLLKDLQQSAVTASATPAKQ